MKMSIPLCAAIIVSGALAGCGDGASVSTSQSDAAVGAPAQAALKDHPGTPSLALVSGQIGAMPAPQVSDPRSAVAVNAPIDPSSPPTAMSPGVSASVDPTPLVSHPANYTVVTAQSADNPEVQVQPVVHYAPDTQ